MIVADFRGKKNVWKNVAILVECPFISSFSPLYQGILTISPCLVAPHHPGSEGGGGIHLLVVRVDAEIAALVQHWYLRD